MGLPTFFRLAEAASITSASDTLTVSAPSQASNHTISFTTPNGMVIGQTIELAFQNTFTLGSIGVEDVDIVINGTTATTALSAAVATWGVSTTSTTVTFTTPTDGGVASATPIIIRIGTNAVDFGTGDTQIVNPSATTTSHYIDVGGTMQDSGQIRVAIVDQVQVSASVDTSLEFTVSGVNPGATVNTSPTTTSATSTSNSLPFGTLPNDGSTVMLAHDLSVTTNAKNGYTVTVEQTGDLQSSTGAVIDGFYDGQNTNTPTAWVAPTANISASTTWGHWGMTSDDFNVVARSAQFGADEWVSGSTTPIAITAHTGPVYATTTRIGYQVQITALQEAGDDYSTQLRYVATPVF
jgi:hypothetical protein